jgi:hypothetical protein
VLNLELTETAEGKLTVEVRADEVDGEAEECGENTDSGVNALVGAGRPGGEDCRRCCCGCSENGETNEVGDCVEDQADNEVVDASSCRVAL